MKYKTPTRLRSISRYVYDPFCDRKNCANVAMYHLGRCGSTVLASLVSRNSDIMWDGELFSKYFARWQRQNNGVEIRRDFTHNPIREIKRRMRLACKEHYGFEIKPFHNDLVKISIEDFVEKLTDLGFSHFIILDRKNRLRKIISSAIAHCNPSQYHTNRGHGSKINQIFLDPEDIRIDFSRKRLLAYLEDYDCQFERLTCVLRDRPHLILTYEDDIERDPQNAYELFCDFVGMQKMEHEILLSKTNPFPVDQLVMNYGEIEKALSGTRFEWMLHD